VPTARLELAQLSPLPPQDSVSTNFTTSARREPKACRTHDRSGLREVFCSPNSLEFYLEIPHI
jgi:hypothetical protein